MRHAKPYRKLSRQRSHYVALLRNLATSLFEHERIRTTLVKAKEVRPLVDKLITLAKSGSLHDRRRAFALLGNKTTEGAKGVRTDVVGKIFKEIAPKLTSSGGYTRIVQLAPRPGDAAPMAYLELTFATPKKISRKKSEAVSEPQEASAAS